MAQTYTRQSTFADGDTITAALFNDEYNQLVNAFTYSSTSASSTGHRHDGTAGQGGNIPKIGDLDFLNKIEVDSTNNRFGFYVEVSSAAVEQIRIQDGAIVPVTDNDIDLGTSSLEFKDLYIDGTANIDTLSVDTSATIAGLTVSGTSTLQGDVYLGNASADTIFVPGLFQANLVPENDSTWNLGSTTSYWANAYIDAITTTGDVAVGGNLTVTGTTTFNGGTITMGDAASDNVVFGADVNSNIIPNTDNTYDLGSSSQEWKDLYIDGTAYLDAINFNGTAITATAAELNIMDGVTATATEINLLDGVTSTTAELNILDGVTSTATELNIVDGDTTATSTTLADADRVVVNDAGTMVQVALTDFETYFESALDTLSNVTTVGALNAGSITSGFGAIDNGSSAITTTGTVTYGNLSDGTITITAFVDEDDMSSDSATLVPTQQSVKAYVDSQVTAQDLDFQADSGGALSIDLDSETMTFTGGTGIDTSGSGNAVTFAIDSTVTTLTGTQTLTNKTLTSPKINEDVAVTATATELNILDGVTSTTAELNILDGVTSTTAELNILDGVTSTASELNILDGVTATTAELNYVDGVTSAIQTQLDAKAPVASPTFTGTVTIPTADVNGGNIDGTTIGASTAAAGTFTTFTSTGIDDNASSTGITIDSSQNVGINEASPDRFLHVNSGSETTSAKFESTGSSVFLQLTDDTNSAYVGADAGALLFQTPGSSFSTKMLIDSSGNVGIGTTSPNTYTNFNTLTINGTNGGVIDLEKNGTLTGELYVQSGATDIVLAAAQSTGSLVFMAGGLTERARINTSGDISIGSSSNHAGARVVINDTPPTAFGSPMFQIGQETFTSSGYYSIGLGYTAASYTEPPVEIAAVTTSSSGGTTADIVFGTRSVTTNTAVTERMRISSSGNVQISTFSGNYTDARLTARNNGNCIDWGHGNTAGYGSTLGANYGSGAPFVGLSCGAGTNSNTFRTYGLKGALITTDNNGSLLFSRVTTATADNQTPAESMRINSSGQVGIGTTSPGVILDIQDSGDALLRVKTTGTGTGDDAVLRLQIGGTTADSIIQFGDSADADVGRIAYHHNGNTMRFFTNGAEDMRLLSGGSLHVDGDVVAFSTSISDERLKDDVQDITGALDTVDALRGVTYTWNSGSREGQRDYGVIAQEVEKVIPEIVYESPVPLMTGDEETVYKTVDYEKLCAVLITAVSELRAEVEALKNAASV